MEQSRLHELGVHTDVPFSPTDESGDWFLRTPPCQGFGWNHHLYTEDEVYEYTLQYWLLPDHYCGEDVVFKAREITNTGLIQELNMYWTLWVGSRYARNQIHFLYQQYLL